MIYTLEAGNDGVVHRALAQLSNGGFLLMNQLMNDALIEEFQRLDNAAN